MSRARRPIAALLLVSAALLGRTAPAGASTLFDPALRFRVLPTEHFIIYFHQGEERLAERLTVIAEEAWKALARPLGVTPPRLTHVVLADQTETSNGFAIPLPRDTIVLYPVWPAGTDFDLNDWLRLAFTHEFTHIVHLDRSLGWARTVRAVFGRTIFAFPNMFLPTWQIEGLATYEESAITGEGRLHAGDFRAIVGEAARQRQLEPLDRVNGGLTNWPSGAGPYAYGLEFHQYLADRFGAERLAALADATARSIPYTASRAFRQVYGEPLGALWREYEASLAASAASPHADTTLTRLTHHGFFVSGPRFDRYACTGCPVEIVYSAANPHGFPAIYRIGMDGGAPRRLATRYYGSTTAIGRDAVYFDQVEVRRNTGTYSDLYEWSRATGRVRQLSRDQRLLDPDLSPDGQTLVCTMNRAGQRDLVLVSTADLNVTPLIAEPDTHFDAPKWSPDGRTIAVERQRLGSKPEIALVDVATRAVRILAADPGIRFATPAWRPDGGAVVVSAAPEEQTFNLYEFALDGSPARQLTRTTGGATWPDVSPDGKTLVFIGYTIDGFDLFSMPYTPGAPGGPQTDSGRASFHLPPLPSASASAHTTTAYSPLATLRPTSWLPVFETASDQLRVGASVGGWDVLGYHAYAATATWLVSTPSDAPRPNAASPDWQLFYAYDRWRPRFYVAASAETSFFAGAATETNTPAASTRRARQVEAGVVFPVQHARVQHEGLLSVIRAADDYTTPVREFSSNRTPIRAAWQTTTARTYGYAVSREDGIAAGVTAELVRRALGSSANATTLTGDVRAYLPALSPHHVIAVRLAGGSSTGDSTVGRTFLLGGAFPGDGVVDFTSHAVSLLRGFADHRFAGSHAAVLNVEYRWPIARPQRGIGTWPIFIHSIHASVFADAGEAWTPAFRADAIKTSAGAEFSADVVAGYSLRFTLTGGAAWGHDPSVTHADRVTCYFRVGKAF